MPGVELHTLTITDSYYTTSFNGLVCIAVVSEQQDKEEARNEYPQMVRRRSLHGDAVSFQSGMRFEAESKCHVRCGQYSATQPHQAHHLHYSRESNLLQKGEPPALPGWQ